LAITTPFDNGWELVYQLLQLLKIDTDVEAILRRHPSHWAVNELKEAAPRRQRNAGKVSPRARKCNDGKRDGNNRVHGLIGRSECATESCDQAKLWATWSASRETILLFCQPVRRWNH